VLQFVLDQGVKHSIEMTRLINEALAQSSVPPEEGSAGADEDGRGDAADGAEEAPGQS
jgi:hypothetical protein